jgi:hypothetical protein
MRREENVKENKNGIRRFAATRGIAGRRNSDSADAKVIELYRRDLPNRHRPDRLDSLEEERKNSMKKTLLMAMSLVVLGLSACEREGPAERAGKQIDSAAERTGEKVEKAGEKMQDAAKDAQR